MFAKDNAAGGGVNRWTINGVAYPDTMEMAAPLLRQTLFPCHRQLHMDYGFMALFDYARPA